MIRQFEKQESGKTQKASLEDQFKNPETLELSGGQIEVVDIVPENLKTDIPTVVAPGWAATPKVFKESILTIAESGRRVISVNASHGIEAEKIENFPDAELRKIAALLKSLEEKSIDKVDAVAHSEAGVYIIIAATLHPEKFRNLILVDSGGIIGQDSFKRLAVDFSLDVVKQVVDSIKDRSRIKPMLRLFWEANKSIGANPALALKEVLALSNSNICEMLEKLREKGIGISVIHAVDDKAFPMGRVQKMVDSGQVDGFYSVKGTHNEIILNQRKYSLLAEKALTDLENKKKT